MLHLLSIPLSTPPPLAVSLGDLFSLPPSISSISPPYVPLHTQGDGASATLRSIGPTGFLSFVVRVVYNFQLAAVFTADVTLYMLRKLQRQVRSTYARVWGAMLD